jgi:RecA/RadA recombinase
MGGGFKHGAHTIVWGNYSVGKTALILTTIANAQLMGKLVCYVNTEKPIEPERFKFFGINLDDLFYIEAPENAEQALEAMRTLCKEKVIDLFVIDSLNGLCPKSVQEEKEGKERGLDKKNVASLALSLSNFYNVVNAYVFRSRASVVCIGQGRTKGIGGYFVHMGLSGGNAQEFYAYQIIAMRRGQNSNAPVKKIKEYFLNPDGKLRYQTVEDTIGFSVVLKLDKTNSCQSAKEKSEIEIPFYYESGFKQLKAQEEAIRIDPEASDEDKATITKMLIEKGIIKSEVIKMVVEEVEAIKEVTVQDHLEEKPKEFQEKVKKSRGRPKKPKDLTK